MTMVLTLIAGTGGRQNLARLAGAVAGNAGITGEPIWLADDACDLVLDAATLPAFAEAVARAVIGDAEIDVLVQPVRNRRKSLLVADMESTIIENEMLDELAGFIGLRQEVSEITRRAMNGEIDFTAALEARISLLAGLPDHVLEEAAGRIRLRAGARQVIATMRSAGAVTALVSSGFMMFAERVRWRLDHADLTGLLYAQGYRRDEILG